ncbi:uncharacterized protein LOC143297608 [Babylonia areolata]|uniref:uncharacterized protein LOC143297608 n=1 Tax=Babylonia areolata TaxID=304850 RepID=UPI003FD3DC65
MSLRENGGGAKGRPRINTARTAIPDLCDRFADSIEDAVKDCPAGNAEERVALINHKREPSEKTRASRKKVRNDTKRIAKRCNNDYWLNICQNIQLSADCGNIRGMYDGMKKAFGPRVNKIAPLNSASGTIITDRSKQVERWAEHNQELCSRENIVTDAAVESTSNLPVMEEDFPPSEEELGKDTDSLACGKAPGKDDIPPEVIKAGKRPCNNYRGISLSIVGKAFARVALSGLQLLAEPVYPEAQCGFRAGRSTIDMVFSLRQLQEQCLEHRRPL